jgi:Co/Zn/Cd efflux system component
VTSHAGAAEDRTGAHGPERSRAPRGCSRSSSRRAGSPSPRASSRTRSTLLADAGVYGLSLYAVARSARLKLRAAHVSGWLQAALALGALADVTRRLLLGSAPEGAAMMGVSLLALAANVTSLLLVARHRDGGAHMKASFIFSTNDVLANLGVILAGLLVAWTG